MENRTAMPQNRFTSLTPGQAGPRISLEFVHARLCRGISRRVPLLACPAALLQYWLAAMNNEQPLHPQRAKRYDETVVAIRAGLKDVAAGRTKPARAALRVLARKCRIFVRNK